MFYTTEYENWLRKFDTDPEGVKHTIVILTNYSELFNRYMRLIWLLSYTIKAEKKWDGLNAPIMSFQNFWDSK